MNEIITTLRIVATYSQERDPQMSAEEHANLATIHAIRVQALRKAESLLNWQQTLATSGLDPAFTLEAAALQFREWVRDQVRARAVGSVEYQAWDYIRHL
jgi:hypothetical protein